MTVEDIRQIQSDYIVASKKIAFADFDGIQLNAGNNFYLSQVINPDVNKRSDDYGGSTFNRLRMLLEIIQVIKKTSDLHVNCRINVYPANQDDSIEICKLLEKYGADSLQITKPSSPQFFSRDCQDKNILVDFTSKIADMVDIPVILGGGFADKNSINNLLNNTNIDFVSMQRPFVYNPTFLDDWANGIADESECRICNNCYWKKTSTCHIR